MSQLDAIREVSPPRPCSWPFGGCGQPIIEVKTQLGRKQVVDAEPAMTGAVVIELVTLSIDHVTTQAMLPVDMVETPADHDCKALGCRLVQEARSRTTLAFRDHHVSCEPFQRLVEERRAERAGRTP